MMRWRNPNTSSTDEENPYWMSFSDMMASLLVIFMLAAAALMLQLATKSEEVDKQVDEVAKAEEVRKRIVDEIVNELKDRQIVIEKSDNDTVLHIPESALRFASGSSDIPESLQNNVREIGNVLFATLNKAEDDQKSRFEFLDTVFIEGHTDNNFYKNPMLRGNWGLSAMRAISVWQFWADDANQISNGLSRMKNHTDEALFSVSGYGETRPRDDAINCEKFDDICHSKNRRIDIRITVKKPSIEELKSIKGK
ncbi:OmpA/MotB family protein [Rodentibacter trehalosifermentans]|uniref:OmpA-like domain-containing protein n=1 Tax=Rodentibacter trehalosifermentans TaxID=1908263 RepID=A0A1V3IQA0_9PAST|nr:OmpA family protein [Rodentibacter trehalosifermentans]OOF44417.1 hypothetical protein BKK51_08990 [Rodentibacter trehalosifermentans]OOF45317.1 hypothetical protein BKK52_12675 [Rodentibacter trehalosifermentans]OOF53957.1 hypothetical protein BKK53_00060 [Rodentibacter trehalosifermentans]